MAPNQDHPGHGLTVVGTNRASSQVFTSSTVQLVVPTAMPFAQAIFERGRMRVVDISQFNVTSAK